MQGTERKRQPDQPDKMQERYQKYPGDDQRVLRGTIFQHLRDTLAPGSLQMLAYPCAHQTHRIRNPSCTRQILVPNVPAVRPSLSAASDLSLFLLEIFHLISWNVF